jgi:hypothetical protein
MTIRVTAGCLAIAAVGLCVAPGEVAARGGGFAGGGRPMMSFSGALRAPIARPAVAPVRPLGAAPAHAGHVAPFAHLRHRRFLAAGFWGDLPWYGGYYDPSGYLPAYQQPTYIYPTTTAYPAVDAPVRERIIYVMPPRPSCSTQTYTVPAEDGGERSINVVRC